MSALACYLATTCAILAWDASEGTCYAENVPPWDDETPVLCVDWVTYCPDDSDACLNADASYFYPQVSR